METGFETQGPLLPEGGGPGTQYLIRGATDASATPPVLGDHRKQPVRRGLPSH